MLLHSKIIGSGQPFIILHGFLGMSDNWNTLGRKFSEQYYEVHLIDQRNHGRSFHDEGFSYDILVGDLKYYCEYYQLTEVILLGHSMGGKTAMLFATTYDYFVQKLIVVDIAPRFYPIHHEAILKGLSLLNFGNIASRKEADEQLKAHVFDVGTRLFLLKNLYWSEKGTLGLRINLEVLAKNVHEVGEPLPSSNNFTGETLFLKGDASEYISIDDESTIKHHFPNSQIKIIHNAGHWLHAENPVDFYNSVIDFTN